VLTKLPKNVVVEAGMNVTLECASDDSENAIIWSYNGTTVSTSPCRSNNSRFVAKSVANGCFLTALGNYSIQGPYECTDNDPRPRSTAQAVVIVIGKIVMTQSKATVTQVAWDNSVLPYAIVL